MIKILTIFGTRPEAIKLAPVVYEIEKYPDKFESIVGVTGQHDTLLKQVLDIFKITPAFNLKVMKQNQSLDDLTVSIISDFGKILNELKPDMILVQGDTTTVFAASLTAFYNKIQIGHIEAGMRTGDKYNPFPEEINRRLTDQLSDLYFAPTEKNRQNLLSEGFSNDKIFITGNTVVDALKHIISSSHYKKPELEKYPEGKTILLTTHRRENFGVPLENIFKAIRQLAKMYENFQFVFPAHPNPNVLNSAGRILTGLDNIHQIPPVDYLTFVNLMKRSFIILSDSGGVQEEAPSLHKPVLILRDKTERPEVVEAGGAILVGTNQDKIVIEFNKLVKDQMHYKKMTSIKNPYGDGDAAIKTVKVLIDHFYGEEK
jgi:UDP-N-acetylglucosamine 2-epimerase (non-hydrolysing)